MLKRADIRFSANSAVTAATKALILPIRVISRHPSTQEALAAAHRVVDAFGKLVSTAQTPGARLMLAESSSVTEASQSGVLSIQQRTAKEAQVDVEFLALVIFDGPAEFWHRAQLVAWALDIVQSFSCRSWPKGVWVIPRRGRFVADNVVHEETVSDPPE